MALQIDSEGVVSLPDGRVVNTVAGAQFRIVQEEPHTSRMYLLRDTTPFYPADEVRHEDMVYSRLRAQREAEAVLASGQTMAMYGIAEGRRLDGSVATTTAWWKVCAL
jgi:hypothetical protein